jgi:hypothetical protein
VATLALVAAAGGLLMAAPAIHSEIGNTYAAAIRVVLGLVCGVLGAPMLVVAAWRKPTLTAAVSVYVPAFGAAVLARLSWSDDYSLTHIAVPLSHVTTLVTFLVVADRFAAPGVCPECGYDLRGLADDRCPECGTTASRVLDAHRARFARHAALLLVAMIVSGAMQTLFIRGILSLG